MKFKQGDIVEWNDYARMQEIAASNMEFVALGTGPFEITHCADFNGLKVVNIRNVNSGAEGAHRAETHFRLTSKKANFSNAFAEIRNVIGR